PPNDEGNADAAFVEIAFDAAQGTGGLEEFGIHAAFLVRAVVAGEDDDGVGVNPEFLQFVPQGADVAVEAGDHGGFVFLNLRPRFAGVGSILGNFHAIAGLFAEFVVGVGNGVG